LSINSISFLKSFQRRRRADSEETISLSQWLKDILSSRAHTTPPDSKLGSIYVGEILSGWWFETSFIFTLTWGRFPF